MRCAIFCAPAPPPCRPRGRSPRAWRNTSAPIAAPRRTGGSTEGGRDRGLSRNKSRCGSVTRLRKWSEVFESVKTFFRKKFSQRFPLTQPAGEKGNRPGLPPSRAAGQAPARPGRPADRRSRFRAFRGEVFHHVENGRGEAARSVRRGSPRCRKSLRFFAVRPPTRVASHSFRARGKFPSRLGSGVARERKRRVPRTKPGILRRGAHDSCRLPFTPTPPSRSETIPQALRASSFYTREPSNSFAPNHPLHRPRRADRPERRIANFREGIVYSNPRPSVLGLDAIEPV